MFRPHYVASSLASLMLGTLAFAGAGCSSTNPTTTSDAGPDVVSDGGSAFSFTPSNFDPTALDTTGVGDVDITGSPCAINSESLDSRCFDPSLVKFTLVTQPNQIKVGIYVAHSWRIEPNAVVNVFGSFPIILVALDKIEILGAFNAAASGDNSTGGGYNGLVNAYTQGQGPGGGAAATQSTGAGGGSYCGTGGAGGAGAGPGGAGGATNGVPEIVPLVGGSSGGGGSRGGGAGGGAIQLVAVNAVSIEAGAKMNLGGGAGDLTSGGGGSGGSLLIEAPTVTVAGALALNGGGGQASGGASDALASNQPAQGGPASGSAAAGGNGSAGATANGAKGADGNTQTPLIGGGGGGGAGRIRINTRSGNAMLTGATLSPDATTPCMTQGTLK